METSQNYIEGGDKKSEDIKEVIKEALARKIMQEKGIKEGYEDADDILASWIAEDIPPMPDPLPKELEELANKGERRLMQKLFGEDYQK